MLVLTDISVKISQILYIKQKDQQCQMLIEFSVGNYRSFKDQVTLSMVAAPIVAEDKEIDQRNVFTVDEELILLKSAAVYGANASGKSNLAKAMSFMRWFMINSSKDTQSTEQIAVEPFRLSTETEKQPSFFEIIFLMEGTQYRYGFEIDRNEVLSEWLYYVPNVRETKLFVRHQDKFEITKKYRGQELKHITRPNALFLSVCAQFNVQIANQILNWTANKLKIISGLEAEGYRGYTARCLNQKNQYSEAILKLIKKLDLGISDLDVEEVEITEEHLPEHFPEELKKFVLNNSSKMPSVNTFHKKYDPEGKLASTEIFDLEEQESEGTQKLFEIAGPLVDTLFDGKVLVIDEFDARLHPLINQAIVKQFNSIEDNPNNAQLIFITHDTNLLDKKLLRRDQVWFTEKNRYGATDLYSLVEYKGVRNDASFENDYIKGRYGAIPFLGTLSKLLEERQ